ncbi:acyltransferase family protein [Microbacterium lacus]
MPTGAAVGQIAPEGAKKSFFRPDIQGLRTVAVVAVILDHLFGWPVGGFVGVDVFFVISGFLITGLLLREHDKTGTISFGGFYIRRVKRIMPAALLVIIVTVGAGYLFFNSLRAAQTLWDGIWATLFAANWHYAIQGTDYFNAGSAISPLQHYWSLAVEEQFYFIWPWLMLLIFWIVGKRRSSDVLLAHRAVGIAMAVIVVGSFAWALYETSTNPTWAYFSLFTRAWELGIGALLAVIAGSLARIPSLARPFLGWIGLVGIAASLFVVNDANGGFPAPWAALPVLSTALVIAAGTGGKQRYLWPIMNPVTSWIGDISYSLYIWHFPLIIFGIALFGDDPLVLGSIFVLTFAVAWVSYVLVEDPLRRARWYGGRSAHRRSKKRLFPDGVWTRQEGIIGVGALAVIVAIMSATAFVSVEPPASASSYKRDTTESPTPTADAASTTPELDALQGEISAALNTVTWPTNLTPTMDDAIAEDQAPADIYGCGFVNRDEAGCTWGDPNAAHSIVLVGNSISMTYVQAIRSAIGTDTGWRIVSWGMFGCPFTDWAVDNINEDRQRPSGCDDRHNQAVDAINSMAPDVVVVSGLLSEEGARAQLSKITTSPRILFTPGPPTTENPQDCYTPTSTPTACVSTVPADWAATERKLEDVGTLVDTRPWFCAFGKCPPFVGTIPMKIDSGHMTAEYADRIAPVIREYLTAAGIGFPQAP